MEVEAGTKGDDVGSSAELRAARSAGPERAESARVEFFSDGVIAIAITLLGLELHVPGRDSASLAGSLAAGWPSYLAFFTSFITVAIIWINHHRLFMHIIRVDHGLLLLNCLLLLTIALVPFGTAVLATHLGHAGARTAAMFYSAILVAVTGAFNLLWLYAVGRRRLIGPTVDPQTIRRISFQYGFGPVLYGVSFGLAWFLSPWASVVADLLFGLYFSLPVLGWSRAMQLHGTAR